MTHSERQSNAERYICDVCHKDFPYEGIGLIIAGSPGVCICVTCAMQTYQGRLHASLSILNSDLVRTPPIRCDLCHGDASEGFHYPLKPEDWDGNPPGTPAQAEADGWGIAMLCRDCAKDLFPAKAVDF